LIGAIVGVYIKVTIAIAKIQVEVIEMKKDLIQKEIAICLIEKNNREDSKENRDDHREIIRKIDHLVTTLIK
jgi:hypothetical protein